jgi:hypothetical protein
VIFDIDLDIPSADIPAEVKNTAKAEAKSATETKSGTETPPLPVSTPQPVESAQDSGEAIEKTMNIVTFFVFVFLVVPLLGILVFHIYNGIKSRK